MNRILLRTSIAALAFLAAAFGPYAASARADEGPPFGTNRVSAAITDVDGEPDVDDYVAPLLKGEALSVAVSATGKSKLLPAVQVLDPAGQDRTPELKVLKSGKSISFSGLAVGSTGRWTVRITGANATQGAYGASFKVKAAPRFGTKAGLLGDGAPRSATHTFEASRGAIVKLTLRPLGKGTVVELVGSSTPDGEDYPALVAGATVRRGVTTVKRHVIIGADGTYDVTVASPDPTSLDPVAKYRLDISVSPQPRGRGTKKFKAAEPRLTALEEPQRIARGFDAVFTGHDLSGEPGPRVLIGGEEVMVRAVAEDGTSVTVAVPELPEPALLDVTIVNRDGQASTRPAHVSMIAAPVLLDVRNLAGVPVRKAPLGGGDALRLVGEHFDEFTTVSFGDIDVPVDQLIDVATLAVTSPASERALVDVIVTDDFGRTSKAPFSFLFPYPGWGEGDVGRLPAPGIFDDFAAFRATAADVDRDGRSDDLVLSMVLRSYAAGGVRHGTRETETRVLVEGADKKFTDGTNTRVPAAFSAPFPYDTDDLNAHAVAVGDLDGTKGDDLLLAGFAETYFDGFGTDTLYGSNRFAAGVRALRNDGAGKFTLDADDQATPQRLRPDLTAKDENGDERPLFGPYVPDRGDPAAFAIGDLDLDGDRDVVLTRAEGGWRRLRQDLSKVDFSTDPPSIAAADADAYVASPYAAFAYVSGTEILDNAALSGGGALRYVTETRMPLAAGGYPVSYLGPDAAGLHGDDVALADLDKDGDLDLVVTWHDPTTVSVKGLKSFLQQEFDGAARPASRDIPRIATRVLLNDGKGRFTDATDAWMPAGAAAEFWQAHRVAAADVDGDGWTDLVLAHRDGVEAWTATAFAPVATVPAEGTVTPGTLAAGETQEFTFTLAADARCSVEAALGDLLDSVLTLHGPDSDTLFATNDDGGTGRGSRLVADLAAGTWTVKVRGFSDTDAGTFTLSVGALPAEGAAIARTRSALRVLRNDAGMSRFLDATDTYVPAPEDGDDLRAGSLRVTDLDGDGRTDAVLATDEALRDGEGAARSSLRVLLRGAGEGWALRRDLAPSPALDSGQADDLVLLPSPEGRASASFLLVSRRAPAASQGGRLTRILDWNR